MRMMGLRTDGGRRCGAWLLFATLAVALLLAPTETLARRSRHKAAPVDSEESQTDASSKSGLTAPYATACVMEPTSGAVIFAKEMHKPWPTASLAKMMLMLIVAEKLHDGSLKLTDQITTSRKAAKMGGSQVYLKEGETFSLEEMMKAVVVHSANDSALAVAEYIAGSDEAFVEMANKRAKELGMADSHYYSVHGLPPAPGEQADVASAYDSAILARELIKYPDILRWSAIDSCMFRNGTFELRNTNHLVRTFRGCDGLKTGFYYKAGFNVVATAKRNGLRLIAVVLGSPRKNQNFGEAGTLLSQGFLNYYMYPVAKKGAPIGQPVQVSDGTPASLKPVWADDLAVFLKHGQEKDAVKFRYELPPSFAAPIKTGQRLGTGDVLVDGKVVGSVPLVAPADVQRQSLFSRLTGKL
jgi:D-alanyl-D-alanine carboxypeptidase (penicillin-binding protein 5/6)